ncbi:MAG: hypothetical protein ACUVRV_03045 [Cyanobacteriota bacterium]
MLMTAATFGGLAFLGAWLIRHSLQALALPLWLLGLAGWPFGLGWD